MINLMKKDVKFAWNAECEVEFQQLKHKFISVPILMHFDAEQEIIVTTDASDYISAGIMSQYDDNVVLHPSAYFLKKHSPAECNYEIYDKELIAIIRCFKEWRPELESTPHPIRVLSDHKNLEYFMSTKLLSYRQARWSEFFSRFNFKIVYRLGKAGAKPDALTRMSGDLPKEGDKYDECTKFQYQAVLKLQNLTEVPDTTLTLVCGQIDEEEEAPQAEEEADNVKTITELFNKAYIQDPIPNDVLEQLRRGQTRSKQISLAECQVDENGHLLYCKRVYVPNHMPLKLQLIRDFYETQAAGHPGQSKTL